MALFSRSALILIVVLFFAYYIAGLPFDTLHAIGNVIFTILLYPFLAKKPSEASFVLVLASVRGTAVFLLWYFNMEFDIWCNLSSV